MPAHRIRRLAKRCSVERRAPEMTAAPGMALQRL
jgi:hypothetical protein